MTAETASSVAGGALQVATGITWSPLVSWWAVAGLAVLAVAVLALAARRRARGTVWRAVALAVILGWLCGPTLIEERRTALPDIALVLVDQTESMRVGARPALAAAAARALQDQARLLPGLELRMVTMPPGGQEGTTLFGAIEQAMSGLPRDRLAAVVAVTDGQVHDRPSQASLPPGVPLHVLLAARGEETDRRLRLIEAPGYGVVGKSVTLKVVVDDLGPEAAKAGAMARLVIRRDGEPPREQSVPVGQPASIELPITHEGPSIVEVTADALPGEVSTLNNRAVVQVTGVRDRLRVLLVSGEPHAGERMWRRLLKADPSVDLVHFTILRPPEKDDLTPLNELALIAFPTRELFQQKVREFDLIILDRFQNRGILPLPYLRNIADYVRQGGGLLVSVGPEFTGPGSLDDTPLRSVLPAHPVRADEQDGTGQDGGGTSNGGAKPDPTPGGDAALTMAVTGPFRPSVTSVGTRHPVTAHLPGWQPDGPAHWGQWYRRIPASDIGGQMLLSAPDGSALGAPLLLLDRVGAGRVALLLSDQIWLWARGHDGGGPQAELMRRIAHWLMKQPDLEENALEARIDPGSDMGSDATPGGPSLAPGADGGNLRVIRRSVADAPPPPVTVIDPAGGRHSMALRPEAGGGLATGQLPVAGLAGVWQVNDGDRTAYAASMVGNPTELADLRATADILAGPVHDSGGSLHWLAPDGAPALRLISSGRVASGRDWIGVPARGAHVTASIASLPLLPDWLALLLLLGSVVFAWWRESD